MFFDARVALELPYNLSKHLTEKQLIDKFGPPDAYGEKHEDIVLGAFGPWYSWDLESHHIHIEYEAQECLIRMATLMVDIPR